jgi:hypothetical protein
MPPKELDLAMYIIRLAISLRITALALHEAMNLLVPIYSGRSLKAQGQPATFNTY